MRLIGRALISCHAPRYSALFAHRSNDSRVMLTSLLHADESLWPSQCLLATLRQFRRPPQLSDRTESHPNHPLALGPFRYYSLSSPYQAMTESNPRIPTLRPSICLSRYSRLLKLMRSNRLNVLPTPPFKSVQIFSRKNSKLASRCFVSMR